MKPRSIALDHRQLVGKLVVVVALMFGFGYALVPMYRAICEALGINVLSVSELQTNSGAASREPVNTQVDATRRVTVEFDANARGPWDFKPERASLDIHPGELTTVLYTIHNRQDRAMVVQAIPSYAPATAGSHFTKVECFCFREHVLGPGETKQWPVVFFVDSKLPKDVSTITLSYTFFEVPGKDPEKLKGLES